MTVQQAKDHLRIVTTDDDDDIDLKLSAASEIVMDYIKKKDVPEDWISDHSPITYDIPFPIKAATLLVLSELFENREAQISLPISPSVEALLERFRDPALA